MISILLNAWVFLGLLAERCLAEAPMQSPDLEEHLGLDLSTFVTRPELRSPSFNITQYDADLITPGYWFIGAYPTLGGIDRGKAFVPFQVGPYIFDGKGELVWSGAGLVNNRNVFDFRLQDVNGSPALTFILGSASGPGITDPNPSGVILDSCYQQIKNISLETRSHMWDMHEFSIFNGTTSINSLRASTSVDVSALELPPIAGFQKSTAKIWDVGFKECDINTGETRDVWSPTQAGVVVVDSKVPPPASWTARYPLRQEVWDAYHLNSVDKNAEGDYLISMRFTSTIYKVSGKDGSIIWRLGGNKSDFVQDFNFSSQHFARFESTNDNITIIRFLDNASDEEYRQPPSAKTSSIKVVAIDENATPKTARLLQQFDRPDGGLTMMRGSAQRLPNGGLFVGWGENGLISEFTPDGQTVLEARWTSDRLASYRAYKFDFVGAPKESPVLKHFAYGDGAVPSSMSTVFFVSWNGATEVETWDFYATNNDTGVARKVGNVTKSGFETSYSAQGFWAYAYAEARGKHGKSLGRSDLTEAVLSKHLEKNYGVASLAVEAEKLQTASQSHHDLESQSVHIAAIMLNAFFTLLGLFVAGKWLLIHWKHNPFLHTGSFAPPDTSTSEEDEEGMIKLLQNSYHNHGVVGEDERNEATRVRMSSSFEHAGSRLMQGLT